MGQLSAFDSDTMSTRRRRRQKSWRRLRAYIDLSYVVALDHPFSYAGFQWENKKGGR
jgi:hypothetical protein